jgi:hypothetical protein
MYRLIGWLVGERKSLLSVFGGLKVEISTVSTSNVGPPSLAYARGYSPNLHVFATFVESPIPDKADAQCSE